MEENTFFSKLFSEQVKDEDGEYFIDRNSEHFHMILDYLRNPSKPVNLTGLTTKQVDDFYDEVEFYNIGSLKKEDTFFVMASGSGLICERIRSNKIRITKDGPDGWNSNVMFRSRDHFSNKSQSWKITLIRNCQFLMCGVVIDCRVNLNDINYSTTGFFVYSNTGGKYCLDGLLNDPYGDVFNEDSHTCILTLENGNLSYIINGKSFGTAFSGLTSDCIVPSIDVYTSGTCFEVEFLE